MQNLETLHSIFYFFLQPSDKKLAELVHPNLIWATVGGEWEEELEDGHADAQTRGPGNALSMFLWPVDAVMQVAETLCQHLSLLDSEKWRGVGKKKERNGINMRKKSRRNRRTDKERLKGLTNSSRGQKKQKKNRLKDELKNGRSLVLWSSLCTYRLSQPSVAALCSLFSPSLKRKIFLFSKFVLFYYLKTVVMMMLLMTMSILLIL